MKTLLRSRYGRLSLFSGLLFWGLEAAVSMRAFQNPDTQPGLWVWEAPISLALLIASIVCAALFCAKELRSRALTSLLFTLGLTGLILATVPIFRLPESPYTIAIYKSRRTLQLSKNDEIVDRFPIGLGASSGDKFVTGDYKTPLGSFQIVDKSPSQFHKWLGLNYPNEEDAWRGRRTGLLTWIEFWYLQVENLNGRIPYGSGPLGGAIGLHGGGATNDWTLGCIALNNDDIDTIYELVQPGTRVHIYP